jgi:biotin carboxylase
MGAGPRPTLLCVCSCYTGDRFLERCKQEGCHVILLTPEQCLHEPWPRHAIDEVFALPQFRDRRTIVNAVAYLARTRPICRIVALDDSDLEVVAHLREHLRLPGLTESAVRLFRDKLAMRAKARDLGVRAPEFVGVINYDEVRHFLATVPGPWLLKPRSGAASAGIQRLHTADEAWRAIDRLADDQSCHLVERLVPGDQYHVESLVADGRVVFAEVNQYWRPILEVYQGGGVYATRTAARDRPEVAALTRLNEQVLTGFALGRGAAHTEFMRAHADGEMYFVETNARVGRANTAEMVEAATGINLWSEWAKLEADPDAAYELPPVRNGYAGVVAAPARQEWPDTAAFADPEVVYRLRQRQRIGLVVAADAPERVEDLLTDYVARVTRDYLPVPPATKAPA